MKQAGQPVHSNRNPLPDTGEKQVGHALRCSRGSLHTSALDFGERLPHQLADCRAQFGNVIGRSVLI
jgi:hypothetical protein